jgi:tetratricopeptide (TPR) repeat protein
MTIPEIANPIIQRAFWTISDHLSLDAAIGSLLDSEQMGSLSDNELIRIIEEADRYWRDKYKYCVRTPGSVLAYAPLMEACCHQRYTQLSKQRDSAPETERAALTARMARLLTVGAHCELARAETLLLNERCQEAYQMFGRAEQMARQMPDEGVLRLYEILWAHYGQWAAASMAHRQGEIDTARAGIHQILLQVGTEAEEYIKKIEQLFSRHQWVFGERARLRQEQQDGVTEHAPSDRLGGLSPMVDLIRRLASEVESGKLSLEAARESARTELPSLHVQPGMMRLVSALYEEVAEIDPERAVRFEEIASELALQFRDHPDVQGAGLYSLGFALSRLARKQGAGFERAMATLERAYELVSSEQRDDEPGAGHYRLQALICREAAISSRYLRDGPAMTRWAEEAVVLSDRWSCPPLERGTVYGLRGEARERVGALDPALDDHFHALELFREAGSALNVRRAYHHIFDLSIRANRLSEAVGAAEEIIEIAREVGDLEDLLETVFELARALTRLGQLESAVLYLDRAEKIVQQETEKNGPNDNQLLNMFRILMWKTRFSVALLGENSALPAEEKRILVTRTRDEIETARQIALGLQRDDLLTEAWLQEALLAELYNPASVQAICKDLDMIAGCPPELMAYGFLLRGRVAARLQDFKEALACLDSGLNLAMGKEYDDIWIPFLSVRGAVKEHLGDRSGALRDYEDAVNRTASFRNLLAEESQIGVFSLAQDALDRLFILNAGPAPAADTRCALHWAEYAKSRALAELLGQSIVLPAPSVEIGALVMEENELLSKVGSGRAASLVAAAQVSLDQRHAMQAMKSRLNEIWDRLEQDYPDYIELRRGSVPSWSEIAEMTTD